MIVSGAAGAASIGVTILGLFATGLYRIESVQRIGIANTVFGMLWIAAVLEEVLFRGILFRLLKESVGTRTAMIASAILFAVAHMANNAAGWITLIMVILAGLLWAGVLALRRAPCIHARLRRLATNLHE
jgi:uncharacterized protein